MTKVLSILYMTLNENNLVSGSISNYCFYIAEVMYDKHK